jgi:hypothetical protein
LKLSFGKFKLAFVKNIFKRIETAITILNME